MSKSKSKMGTATLAKYCQKGQDYEGEATYIMYHGTTMKAARQIKRRGFIRSTHGMLGPGVYVSRNFNKAACYPKGAKGQRKAVLKLSVRVGRVKKIDKQGHSMQKTWHEAGYDTAWVPPSCGMVKSERQENCVWDPKRITVLDILENNNRDSSDDTSVDEDDDGGEDDDYKVGDDDDDDDDDDDYYGDGDGKDGGEDDDYEDGDEGDDYDDDDDDDDDDYVPDSKRKRVEEFTDSSNESSTDDYVNRDHTAPDHAGYSFSNQDDDEDVVDDDDVDDDDDDGNDNYNGESRVEFSSQYSDESDEDYY